MQAEAQLLEPDLAQQKPRPVPKVSMLAGRPVLVARALQMPERVEVEPLRAQALQALPRQPAQSSK
jgi:hypothetical protein